MQGASFTISSLGGIGGTAFTPLVTAPEVAILGSCARGWRGLGWRELQAAPDAAAVDVVRPSRHRRSAGRSVHASSRPRAGGRSSPGPLTDDPARLRRDTAMSTTTELRLPDIGDFKDVPVIEVHVHPGARIAVDDTLVTLGIRQGDDGCSGGCGRDGPRGQGEDGRSRFARRPDHHSGGRGRARRSAEGAHQGGRCPVPGPGHAATAARAASTRRSRSGSRYRRLQGRADHRSSCAAGGAIKVDDPLITLESDKATMEVPAAQGGTIREVKVKVGDRVSEGDVIAVMDGGIALPRPRPPWPGQRQRVMSPRSRPEPTPVRRAQGARAGSRTARRGSGDLQAEVLVLGAGPGG